MQEIYANLPVLSLTALIALGVACELKLDPKVAVPSFQNAQAIDRRLLFEVILAHPAPTRAAARSLATRLIDETFRVVWGKKPGRSYPRVSPAHQDLQPRQEQKSQGVVNVTVGE